MRVETLSVAEPALASGASAPAVRSGSTSFSDALAQSSHPQPSPAPPVDRSSQPGALVKASAPAKPTPAVTPSSPPNSGVRLGADASVKCPGQSGAQLNLKANAKPKLASAPGANASSTDADVKANAKPAAQQETASSGALANAVAVPPPQPVPLEAASLLISLTLPALLAVDLPAATLSTSDASSSGLHTDSLEASSTAGGDSSANLVSATSPPSAPPHLSPSLAGPLFATPLFAVPLFTGPLFAAPPPDTAFLTSAARSNDPTIASNQMIASKAATLADPASSENDPSVANEPIANHAGFGSPVAPPSLASELGTQMPLPAPANDLVVPFPIPAASLPVANFPLASDASPDSHGQPSSAVVSADVVLKDIDVPMAPASGGPIDAPSFQDTRSGNATVGDVPHLPAQPASPTLASSGVATNDPGPLSESLPLTAATLWSVSLTNPGAASHAAAASAPHATDSRAGTSAVAPSGRDSAVASVRDSAAPATPAVSLAAELTQVWGAAVAPDRSSAQSSASLAAASSNAEPAAASPLATVNASSSGAASANSVAPDAFLPESARNSANSPPPASAGTSSTSSSGQKPAAAPRSPAPAAPASAAPTNTPAAGDAASASLVAPALAPNPSPSASDSPAPEKTVPASALPPAHQMLDSAPAVGTGDAISAPPTAHLAPDADALHMQVGVHTSSFGNVEVHTVIEQGQVGISIHGDRDLARWFNSEVGGLEAGLKNQHLNLTGVDFSSTRSGVQTATGFQHGQPRQNPFQTPGSCAAARDGAPPDESANEPNSTAALPAQVPETRVSVHV